VEEEPKWNHDRRRDLGVAGAMSGASCEGRDGPAPGVSMSSASGSSTDGSD
jgi:hypothetical protein